MLLIKKIINFFRALFFSHVPSKEELEFIRENNQYWSSSVQSRGRVLVETYLSTPASLLEKFIIVKTLERTQRLSGLVILNSFKRTSSPAYAIAKSFGLLSFFCWWKAYFNPLLFLKALFFTVGFFSKHRKGHEIIDYSIKSIHIGDLIYDTLIRFKPQSYTVQKLSCQKYFRLVFRAIYGFFIYEKIFDQNDIKAVVTSHSVYAEFGILCRIANSRRIAVFLKDMDVFSVYHGESNIYDHFLKIPFHHLKKSLNDPLVVERAESYFLKRMAGQVDQIDLNNAFLNKKNYDRRMIASLFGLDNAKKNVIVMCHAFSDAPHSGGFLLYQDYYVWLKETLILLADNVDVNVLVKPHPSSYMWNEKGAVEELLEELGIKSVYITPSDMSSSSIRHIADYLITARGTAGLEYSGYGIPAITCASGYYSGFGVAIEALDLNSYAKVLRDIILIQPLPESVRTKAKVILYLTFSKLVRSSFAPDRHILPGDDAKILIPLHFSEMARKLRQAGGYSDSFVSLIEARSSEIFN